LVRQFISPFQVELHPAYPQFELLEYCKSKGVILSAYSPLGQYNSPLFKDQTLHEIAEKENASIAQASLSSRFVSVTFTYSSIGTTKLGCPERDDRYIQDRKGRKNDTKCQGKVLKSMSILN